MCVQGGEQDDCVQGQLLPTAMQAHHAAYSTLQQGSPCCHCIWISTAWCLLALNPLVKMIPRRLQLSLPTILWSLDQTVHKNPFHCLLPLTHTQMLLRTVWFICHYEGKTWGHTQHSSIQGNSSDKFSCVTRQLTFTTETDTVPELTPAHTCVPLPRLAGRCCWSQRVLAGWPPALVAGTLQKLMVWPRPATLVE